MVLFRLVLLVSFLQIIYSCNSNKTLKLMEDLNQNGKIVLDKENLDKINQSFCSESLSEEETKLVIKNVYNKEKIL